MSLPDPVHFDGRPVEFSLRSYSRVLAALVRVLGPRSQTGYALLARPPEAVDAGATPHPRSVWPTIRSAFVPTWTRWTNESARRRWHRVALPEHTDSLATLAELTASGVGSAFVHTLALAREDEWVLVAVPHHSTVRVADDATLDAPVTEALAPFRAALAAPATAVSWTDGDAEWCVETGTLRVRDDEGTRGWSLRRVSGVERTGESELRVEWADRKPADVVQRVVGRLLPDPAPPRSLAFPDADTRDRVADAIESFLERYRPATAR